MKRKTFLTWMGLSFLATISPVAIAAWLEPAKSQTITDTTMSSGDTVLFYVAPNGDDSWSGTLEQANSTQTDGPFATLQQARDAIRQLKSQQGGTLQQPVTVFVRGGTYFLSETLKFTFEDSGTEAFPITYKAYPNENPVISGGKLIQDWQQQGQVWVANLPEVKQGNWYFRLLRVGDDWAIRARYPNYEPNNPLQGGWLYAQRQGMFNVAVGNVNNVGDKLVWNILVPAAGTYRVWLRYAHKMQNPLDERMTLRVGSNQPVTLRNLPSTGDWNNYSWAETGTLDLATGEQQLVWQNTKGGGINLDAFCLTDDPNWSPVTAIKIASEGEATQVTQPQDGKNLLLVHAETYQQAVGSKLRILSQQSIRDRLAVDPTQFPNWQNWEGAEVHIFPNWGWVNAIIPVTQVDPETATLYLESSQDIRPGNRFFIANAKEALDSPGEWCLDKSTGELLYWPQEPNFPSNVEVVAPTLERLMVLEGNAPNNQFVQQLHFSGLTFTDTDYNLQSDYYLQSDADAAIWLLNTQQCVIENCRFVKLGGYGIKLGRRSHDNKITQNQIRDLGQGGVILVGNNLNKPVNNLIAANDIQNCGQVYKHVAGVIATSGDKNRIVHNRIARMPRYGISLKSFNRKHYSHNNLVEYNEISDTNLETNDAGAIETLGADRQPSGNIIRFNQIRNVVGMRTTANGKIVSPYFTWGIYLDDYSSGTTVFGNIVVDTVLGAICLHGGKDNVVENNIFINGSEMQIRLQPKDAFMKGNVFRHNIVVYNQPQAMLLYCNKNWSRDRLSECDLNLYWHSGNLNLATTERAITPVGNFRQWQEAGFDRNSLITEPLFVALRQGEFKLKSNSPVFTLDFQEIPAERIGLKGFNP